ncbi:MAG: nicotinate-nucleotide adenylyltransferase [Candidatus Desulfatibia sp.]|uniref:nicotinate-nucleotide adenylyltransferase n=1 Tax=Candidatus Desulfatibia sp. TaxID=3101189 RepID=UPI002F2F6C92
MKRIGLFGGTFNPIHRGHLQVIQEVMEAFDLDQIKLIPAALPPHKEPGGVADARDRLQMIRLAVANYPALAQSVTASDVELTRPGPSYTIDTVRYFMQVLPENTGLFFILGLDAFHEIDTWKSYLDLFDLIPFIVMARPGVYRRDGDLMWEILEKYLKSKISDAYRLSVSQSCYVHAEKQPIFVFDVTPVEISSTQIRESVKNRRNITSLVPKKVENFIKTKGLYL